MKVVLTGRTASLALLTILAASASANLFVNPGFEDPIPLNGWTVTPTQNGQTRVQTTEVFETVLGVPSLAGKFAVGQVNFQAGVPEGIELTQDLFLNAGVRYDFSYDVAAYNSGTLGNAQGGIFTPIVSGNPVGAAFAAGSIDPGQTKRSTVTGTFTPTTSGVYTVGLRIARPFTPPVTLFQYVDNAVAVPEPATAMALLGGLAALALRRRRK